MNKKWLTLIGVIVVIVVIILLTGKSDKNNEITGEVSEVPGEYVNEDFGIAFSYPDQWDYTEAEYPSQDYICFNYNENTGDCGATVTISWDSDIDTWYNGVKQVYKSFNVEEEEADVIGSTGRLLVISGYGKEQSGNSRELVFEQDGKVYTIGGLRGEENAFEEIVDSFQILGEEMSEEE